jgi:uncharacterized protein
MKAEVTMPLLINMRHLEAHNLTLEGKLQVEELDMDTGDEVERVEQPLTYHLEAQLIEGGLLVQGSLRLPLACQCVRCLKPFTLNVVVEDWTRHFMLEGEEAIPVVNDCVDLTPYVREDMLLEFPQHPLCSPDCGGLPSTFIGQAQNTSQGQPVEGSPAWDELNKLKF